MAATQEEAASAASIFGPCVGRSGEENSYLKNELQLELPKLICQGVRLSTPSDAIRSSPALPGPERTLLLDSVPRGKGVSPKILPSNAYAPNSTNEDRKPVSLHPPPPPPACRRRLLCDFEKDLTFRPKLNMLSVKLASRNARSNVPVVHRLLEVRKTVQNHYHQHHLTFAPKLNAVSVRLAQERVSRMPEVQERLAQLTAARTAEVYAQYTFKPHISERSLRITEGLGTSFLVRQQKHIQRRQKVMDEAYQVPPRQLSRSRRMIKLIPRVPPPPSTKDTPPTKETQLCPCATKASCISTQSPPPPTRTDTPESPSHANRDPQSSPPRRSRSTTPLHGTRPSALPLQSPSRQSLREARSPHKHQRRMSAPISNKMSPVVGKSRGGRCAGSPQSKVPSCAQAEVKFEDLSELDRVKRVRVVAERIMRAKKVFLCRGGYRSIRKSLRQRGWVEQEYTSTHPNSQPNESPTKVHSPRTVGAQRLHRRSSHDKYADSSSDDDSDAADLGDEGSEEEYSDEEEYRMLSRAVRSCPPHFVWTLRRDDVLYRSMHREALANHFARACSFTTKVGLCTNLRNLRWYGDTDPDVFYPRCYRLSCDEEKETFIDDYRFTTALCILKQLVQQYHTRTPATPTHIPTPPRTPSPVGHSRPPSSPTTAEGNKTTSRSQSRASMTNHPLSESGNHRPSIASRSPSRTACAVVTRATVPEEAVGLALRACEAYLSSREHDDIEGSQQQLCPKLLNSEWDELIQHFYSIVFEDARIVCGYHCVARAISTLDEMESHFPQLHMDGARNIWIVKPGALSRGRGIVCMDKLEDILELVSSSVQKKENKWVVQKYIEQPLLIYETKFDIRQWFLVTDWNPLTMWMYKECYLRFSTQRYTLDDLDVSVHLCNNSVQKNYENSSTRSDLLPEENMWDSDTFKQYLSSCGRSDDWDTVIYPGMKQALINVLQVTQDEIEHRKNSFELYGADFMISEDFKPWLIEINCSPTMESSTAVTARMCRQVLEDTIKVAVDRREERDCDTGRFELAYKQPKLEMPAYVGIQLCVEGSSIPKPGVHRKAHTMAAPVIRLGYRSA